MGIPKSIAPEAAARLVEAGAVLVDIRAPDEYRRRYIRGARNVPVDSLTGVLPDIAGRPVIFLCRSGMRTSANAGRLAAAVPGESYLLAGGLDAWAQAGLPVVEDRGQPLEIMRQVQIVAGTLILVGVLAGTFVSPVFYALSGFVGAGLLVAGITGFCGMARLLTWFNQRLASPS